MTNCRKKKHIEKGKTNLLNPCLQPHHWMNQNQETTDSEAVAVYEPLCSLETSCRTILASN